MNNTQFFIYLAILVSTTYLIRVIPFVALRKKIKNQYINSFLFYIPYTVLASMTFPSCLYATGNIYSALSGTIVAIIFAYLEKSIIVVVFASSLAVLLVNLFINMI